MPRRKKATGADSNQSRSQPLQPQSAGSALARTHQSTHELRDIAGITYTELNNRHEAAKAKDAAVQAREAATELKETKEHKLTEAEVSAKLFGLHNEIRNEALNEGKSRIIELEEELAKAKDNIEKLETALKQSKSSAQAAKTRTEQLESELKCAATIEAGLDASITRRLETIRRLRHENDVLTAKVSRIDLEGEQCKISAQTTEAGDRQLQTDSRIAVAHCKCLSPKDVEVLELAAAAHKDCPSGEDVKSLRRVADLHLKYPSEEDYNKLKQFEEDHAECTKECESCRVLTDALKEFEQRLEKLDMEMD
ncbi:hypothetical protein CBER1_05774 [Cercospora berteroae]|uniref:Uncharacterized protein n=1 Tax=Cercospora berteroae TaxID=357750 RepID=A0A2S6CI00_9PEZI|nr:hypothetical protein CBER1_05774 [Cercospora berteroae]